MDSLHSSSQVFALCRVPVSELQQKPLLQIYKEASLTIALCSISVNACECRN